jgi:Family of unknown function (DUF5681)
MMVVKAAPDNTQKQQGRWLSGQSGNPSGRPPGSRNKLSEDFLNTFAQYFERHGRRVIEKVRDERPRDYLRIAASLLPKQMEIEANRSRPAYELTDEELSALLSNDIDVVIDRILIDRGHAPLSPAEREHMKQD